jgi:hypothetical protein
LKLIEALKKNKELQIKAEDLRGKVAKYCADQSHETAVYGDRQKEQIKEWIQAHHDVLQEIAKLRVAVQRTNIATQVTIELGGLQVTKSIAEWIHRRKDLASSELAMWMGISDRGLKEGTIKTSTGELQEIKIRRYYDPKERDNNVELYRTEAGIIDRVLETINAVTDVVV